MASATLAVVGTVTGWSPFLFRISFNCIMFGLLPGLINLDQMAIVDINLAKLSVLAHLSDK
jgi:hypothetical protein